jgi:hypothetical protein
MTPPEVWNEAIVGYTVASRAASCAGGAWTAAKQRTPVVSSRRTRATVVASL